LVRSGLALVGACALLAACGPADACFQGFRGDTGIPATERVRLSVFVCVSGTCSSGTVDTESVPAGPVGTVLAPEGSRPIVFGLNPDPGPNWRFTVTVAEVFEDTTTVRDDLSLELRDELADRLLLSISIQAGSHGGDEEGRCVWTEVAIGSSR
jgi:hypothetical protein